MDVRAIVPGNVPVRGFSPLEANASKNLAGNATRTADANQAAPDADDSSLARFRSWITQGFEQFTHRLVKAQESLVEAQGSLVEALESPAAAEAPESAPCWVGKLIGAIQPERCLPRQSPLRLQLNVISMNKRDGTPFHSADQIISQLLKAEKTLSQAGIHIEVVTRQGNKPVGQLNASDIVHIDPPRGVNLDDGLQQTEVFGTLPGFSNVETQEMFPLIDAVKDENRKTMDAIFVGDMGSSNKLERWLLGIYVGIAVPDIEDVPGSDPRHLGTLIISDRSPGARSSIVAHEVAHLLGEEHVLTPLNLLGPILITEGVSGNSLTAEQISRMRGQTDWLQPI